jgi:hypothetical protein
MRWQAVLSFTFAGALLLGAGCAATIDEGPPTRTVASVVEEGRWSYEQAERQRQRAQARQRGKSAADEAARWEQKRLAALGVTRSGGRVYRKGWAWPRGAPYRHAPPDYRYPPVSDSASSKACLERLDQAGVTYRVGTPTHAIMTPVWIYYGIGGVNYRLNDRRRALRPMLIDCEMALSLYAWSAVLRAQDVVEVRYSNTWRAGTGGGRRHGGYPHKHAMGYAIDAHQFVMRDGRVLDVQRDYERLLGDEYSCLGQPRTDAGRVLRAIACETAASSFLRPPITPDDNWDHRNHFHVEGTSLAERRLNREEHYAGGIPTGPYLATPFRQ